MHFNPQMLPMSIEATQSVPSTHPTFSKINAMPGQLVPKNALDQLHIPSEQITETGIVPNSPYYELPAGLMAPLVAPSQRDYKPLKPADLRLPLPKFPDEEFLKSIESYYGNDGKTRDNDGWDREFIDMYMGQKAALA